ncbi:vitamin K epoxide reductase family protein [Candidatus Pacearchaeota archaeon]|nr:vitamin K epoxide reductase family protein [Candidatus Pacearchaeota archaeon]
MNELWLILLSVFGLLISSYIALTRLKNKRVVCPINSISCNNVLESKWSSTLGIKNDILGWIYYISIIIGIILVNQGYFAIEKIIIGASVISAFYSLFLILIQISIIKEFCFYCILTSITNIGIFALLIQ